MKIEKTSHTMPQNPGLERPTPCGQSLEDSQRIFNLTATLLRGKGEASFVSTRIVDSFPRVDHG